MQVVVLRGHEGSVKTISANPLDNCESNLLYLWFSFTSCWRQMFFTGLRKSVYLRNGSVTLTLDDPLANVDGGGAVEQARYMQSSAPLAFLASFLFVW